MGQKGSKTPEQPTVVVFVFEEQFHLTRKKCYAIHCAVNNWVQSASACLLYAADAKGKIYNSSGVPIKYLSDPDLALMKRVRRPNSIGFKTLQPMSHKDIKDLFWILRLNLKKFGLPKIPKFRGVVCTTRVYFSRQFVKVWYCHCAPKLDQPQPKVGTECPICYEVPKRAAALVPCGHATYCWDCATKLETCALCRTLVEQPLKLYT